METVNKDANNKYVIASVQENHWLSFMVYTFSWQRFLN